MAQLNASGDLQLEQSDIIPREIAVKTDDPPEIVQFIEALNQTKFSQKNFEHVIALVDAMRKEYHSKDNPDLSVEAQK